jgi:hypothetical protein
MALRREQYIEQIRRMIYGGFPPEQAEITVGLVNQWLNQAIGYAAQKCYTDNLKIEGIASVNSGFYTTFKALPVTQEETFLWKIALPEVPPGLGNNEGVSTLKFKGEGQISQSVVWMSSNQVSFYKNMRDIPNKLLGYYEGSNVYVLSPIQLSQYTAHATVISGGDSTDLDSVLNVPPDYLTFVTEYMKQQLGFERNQVVENQQDGIDAVQAV